MLTEVLRTISRFERTHGYSPNTVLMNAEHWRALMADCPGLRPDRGDGSATELGFLVLVLPRESALHPHAAFLPAAARSPAAQTERPTPRAAA